MKLFILVCAAFATLIQLRSIDNFVTNIHESSLLPSAIFGVQASVVGLWVKPNEYQPYQGAEIAGIGLRMDGEALPSGFLDQYVENSTMLEKGCFYVKYSQQVPASSIYFELDRHLAPEPSYTALAYLNVQVHQLSDEERGDALRDYALDDQVDRFKCRVVQREATGLSGPWWLEGGANLCTSDTKWGWTHQPCVPLMFVKVERGWDDVDRFAISLRGFDGRSWLDVLQSWRRHIVMCCWFGIALSFWIALLNAIRTRIRACKLSLCAVSMLACASFFVDVLAYVPCLLAGDAWHILPIVADQSLCSGEADGCGRVLGLDTREGAGMRSRLQAELWVLVVMRFLQGASLLKFCWSLWIERHILVHCIVVFALSILYECMVAPFILHYNVESVLKNLSLGVAGFVFPCLVWAMQHWTRTSITALAKQDLEIWQHAYDEIISREGSRGAAALDRLARLSEPYLNVRVRHAKHPDDLQQSPGQLAPARFISAPPKALSTWSRYRRIVPEGLGRNFGWSRFQGRGEGMSFKRVGEAEQSIDQIYLQAQLLLPFFSHLLRGWAGRCDCIVPVTRANEMSPPASPLCGSEAEAKSDTHAQSESSQTESALHTGLSASAVAVSTGCSPGWSQEVDDLQRTEGPTCASRLRATGAAMCVDDAQPGCGQIDINVPIQHTGYTYGKTRGHTSGQSDTSSSGTFDLLGSGMPSEGDPRRDCLTFEKWNDVRREMEEGTFCGQVHMSSLKKVHRMMEKTLRCYRGDASRLTDVCRGVLGFDSLEALADCLATIIADPLIKVEGIKNRMDPSYNVSETQGYRDVNVTFRIMGSPMACITADAWHELRLSWHVCEVQLLPMEFLEMKKRTSHKNYIRYRNLKSE